jgi:hypothetical protein
MSSEMTPQKRNAIIISVVSVAAVAAVATALAVNFAPKPVDECEMIEYDGKCLAPAADCAKNVIGRFYHQMPDASTKNTSCRIPTAAERATQCVDKGNVWRDPECHSPAVMGGTVALVFANDTEVRMQIDAPRTAGVTEGTYAYDVRRDSEHVSGGPVTFSDSAAGCLGAASRNSFCHQFVISRLSPATTYSVSVTVSRPDASTSAFAPVKITTAKNHVDTRTTVDAPSFVNPGAAIKNNVYAGDATKRYGIIPCTPDSVACASNTMKISLRWSPPAEVLDASIRYTVERINGKTLVDRGEAVVTATDAAQAVGASVAYRVKLESANFRSEWGAPLHVLVPAYTDAVCTRIPDDTSALIRTLRAHNNRCTLPTREDFEVYCTGIGQQFYGNACAPAVTPEVCAAEAVPPYFHRVVNVGTNGTTCRDPTDVERRLQCGDKQYSWVNNACYPRLADVELSLVHTGSRSATLRIVFVEQANVQASQLTYVLERRGDTAPVPVREVNGVVLNTLTYACQNVAAPKRCVEFDVDDLDPATQYAVSIIYKTNAGETATPPVQLLTQKAGDEPVYKVAGPTFSKPAGVAGDVSGPEQAYAVQPCTSANCAENTMNVVVRWTATAESGESEPTVYLLQRRSSLGSASWEDVVRQKTTVHHDYGLNAPSAYDYRVRFTSATYASDWSAPALHVVVPAYTDAMCALFPDSSTPLNHLVLRDGRCRGADVSRSQQFCLAQSKSDSELMFFDSERPAVCATLQPARYTLSDFTPCVGSDCSTGSKSRTVSCAPPTLNGKPWARSDFDNWTSQFRPSLVSSDAWATYANCPPQLRDEWSPPGERPNVAPWRDQGNDRYRQNLPCMSAGALGANSSCCSGRGTFSTDLVCECVYPFDGPTCATATSAAPQFLAPINVANDVAASSTLAAIAPCVAGGCAANTMNVSLAWSAPAIRDGNIRYSLRRRSTQGEQSWKTLATGIASQTYLDTNVPSGGTYTYEIMYRGNVYRSDWSSANDVAVPGYTDAACALVPDSTTPMGTKVAAQGKCVSASETQLQQYCLGLSEDEAHLQMYGGGGACHSLQKSSYNLGSAGACLDGECELGRRERRATCALPTLNGQQLSQQQFRAQLGGAYTDALWEQYYVCPPAFDSSDLSGQNESESGEAVWGAWACDANTHTCTQSAPCVNGLGENSKCCNRQGTLGDDLLCACDANTFGPTCSLTQKQFTCSSAGALAPNGQSCVCESADHAGQFCQFSRETTCRGRGRPTAQGGCVCDGDWAGAYCECPNPSLTCTGRDQTLCSMCSGQSSASLRNDCTWGNSQSVSRCRPTTTDKCMKCLGKGAKANITVSGDHRASGAAEAVMGPRCCSGSSSCKASGRCGSSHEKFSCTCE